MYTNWENRVALEIMSIQLSTRCGLRADVIVVKAWQCGNVRSGDWVECGKHNMLTKWVLNSSL